MRRLGHRSVLATIAGAVALSFATAWAQPPSPLRKRPEATGRRSLESDRDSKLRKAREEIRRDPSQKKFILFRYGLKEDELR